MADTKALVQRLDRVHGALLQERRSWEADWKSLAMHFLPRKCRLLESESADTNQGGLRSNIVDSTGIYAMRDLAAGMHGGMTSPARPWFRLGIQDSYLEKRRSVRAWLDEVELRLRELLHRSNFYNAVHRQYEELGTFGTGFMWCLPDSRTGLRFNTMTVGEYSLDVDVDGRVDTVFRVMDLTARQIVQKFGYASDLPEVIKNDLNKPGRTVQRYRIVHGVYPRDDRTFGSPLAIHKAFASVYYIAGISGSQEAGGSAFPYFLREGGYDTLPGFGPRWDVTGQDVWGRSPGMDTLPDCRMLQQMSVSLLKALHKEVDPPMVGPAGLKGIDLLPGGMTLVDSTGNGNAIYPALQVRHNVLNTMQAIKDVQNKIKEGLFNNLFRMLLNSDRRQITAKEVAAREEEKLILIGPVLERLHDELFIPLIDRAFTLAHEQDLLPQAPDEMQGLPIKVEFVSLLAQAQKMVATSAVDQFMGFIAMHAPAFPELLDVPDMDKMADGYAGYLGVEADMLKAQEDREAKRDQRAKEQAQAQQLAAAQQGADVASKMGGIPVGTEDNPSAIQALMSGLATNPTGLSPQ